jgi:uncharacterized UPF0146 family protein
LEKCGRVEGLIDYIAGRYTSVVEIGIGHAPKVAVRLLEKGISIVATDTRPFYYEQFKVIVDDITEPDLAFYRNIDLIYSIKPPPELVPYMKKTAKSVSSDLIVKPLASDFLDGQLIRHGNTSFYIWMRHDQD